MSLSPFLTVPAAAKETSNARTGSVVSPGPLFENTMRSPVATAKATERLSGSGASLPSTISLERLPPATIERIPSSFPQDDTYANLMEKDVDSGNNDELTVAQVINNDPCDQQIV